MIINNLNSLEDIRKSSSIKSKFTYRVEFLFAVEIPVIAVEETQANDMVDKMAKAMTNKEIIDSYVSKEIVDVYIPMDGE